MIFLLSTQRVTALLSHVVVAGAIFISLLPTQATADEAGEQVTRIEQQGVAGINVGLLKDVLHNLPNNTQGNNAIVFQKGSDNISRISQFRTGNYLLGNMAWVYQNGNGNVADIHQVGGSNIVLVHQHGDGFTAAINQAGNELSAAINQYGLNAEAMINQFGSASQSVSIEQLSRSGAGMTVTVESR